MDFRLRTYRGDRDHKYHAAHLYTHLHLVLPLPIGLERKRHAISSNFGMGPWVKASFLSQIVSQIYQTHPHLGTHRHIQPVSCSHNRSRRFVWTSAPVGVGMRATWISRLQESFKSSKTTASKSAKLSAGVERRPKPTELKPAGPMNTLSLKNLPPTRNVLKVSSIFSRQTIT
jgi:hypothetical protein